MNDPDDTIIAVSSPLGAAARAIVRLSGPRALEVALTRFQCDAGRPPGATYRWYDGAVTLADAGAAGPRLPATLLLMRGPRSYTRDDVAELHVAGCPAVVDDLMTALCRAGARPAAPGEFTARAFLSGRLDLAQAEAVMAIVAASGRRSLAAAERLLEGRLSGEVAGRVDRLRRLLARVELAIDFSDQDVPLVGAEAVRREAAALRDDVVGLARRSRDLAHLDGDLRVALVGRPNVGKSSLFNRLAGADRAIVTDVAGTTRDELREAFQLAGARFVLSDTAGLADAVADLDAAGAQRPAGTAEPAGGLQRGDPDGAAQRRTLSALARAEVVLVVVEAGRMIRDAAARRDVGRLLATLAAPAILVVSKCDLAVPAGDGNDAGAPGDTGRRARAALRPVARGVPVVTTSAATGHGVDALREALVRALRLGDADRSADAPAVSARHRRCLERAAEALERAVELCGRSGGGESVGGESAGGESVEDAPPGGTALSEDLLAMELREALDALGGITGASSPQDVLGEIFAGFCIGK